MKTTPSKRFECPLRAYSKTLSPEEISRRLGLEATLSHELGSCRAAQHDHVWEFEPEYEAGPEDLGGRVEDLLRALRPIEARITSLRGEANFMIWGACMSRNPETSIHLSTEVLGELARLGIEFYISVYATCDDEEE